MMRAEMRTLIMEKLSVREIKSLILDMLCLIYLFFLHVKIKEAV